MPMHSNGRTRRGPALRWMLVAALAGGPAYAGDGLPSGTVSLREAVDAALRLNPELAARSYAVREEDARAVQEGLPPNPSLHTEVENVGRFDGDPDEAEPVQTTVSLSQLLELGGKRGKRASVARLDGRLADRDRERARRDVAARTLKAFVAVLAAQERVALADGVVRLAREAVAAARRQVAAGVGSPVERTRAEAALAQAEALRARRTREERASRVALAGTWGAVTPTFERVAGRLAPVGRPRPLADFRARLAENPDLARWDTAVERARAAVTLEEARRIPDVTVRVGSRRFVDAETNAFVAEVSVPLPVFDRNQGGILAAYERLERTRAERQAAAVEVETALAAGYEALLAAWEHATELEGRVLPAARDALAATRRGHAEGVLGYLDVLDARRTVVELEGERLDALTRYHDAAADLERLTGLPVTAPAE